MKAALAGHLMTDYDRSKVGLPEPKTLRVPARDPIDPGHGSVFFRVARLIPELTEGAKTGDSYLRMLASSHDALISTDAFGKFEQRFPDSPLLQEIHTRTAPGPLTHPKVAATADWVSKRLAQGRHVLIFCVYVETQTALLKAITTRANNDNAAMAPLSAATAKRIHERRFGREPGGRADALALVVRDNLSEGIDLDGGNPCIVHHDLSWNPARFDQRMGRIIRASSGFKVPADTDVFIPVLNVGLDNRLYDTMANRATLSDYVLRALPPELDDPIER